MKQALPGNKLFVTYGVCYEYKVPLGEIEYKWDAELKEWRPIRSSGALGYVYSDPILACSVEFKSGIATNSPEISLPGTSGTIPGGQRSPTVGLGYEPGSASPASPAPPPMSASTTQPASATPPIATSLLASPSAKP